jgi:acyl carrier protein
MLLVQSVRHGHCGKLDVVSDRIETLRSVVETLAGKAAPADPEESLFESGLLDSFMLVDLVAAIESQFKIKVPDADLNPRKFDSLARIDSYLSQL